MENKADIGLIGLAVMGQNLVLNMNDQGFHVSVYNRTHEKVDAFLKGPASGTNVTGTHQLQEFVASLKRPRKILLMIKAGSPVDQVIDQLVPFLEKGDVIVDGGNSLFTDSNRRAEALKEKGLLFIGMGISGGEEGARHGPSMMPGGHEEAWPLVKEIFTKIAAKTPGGDPCCDWIGPDGSGHYVKMIHNGIEYGDMQLIAESYDLMRRGLQLNLEEICQIFQGWNEGELDSYLIEITSKVLAYRDEKGVPLIDQILDAAGQKGTGKWTVMNALEIGSPLTLISEAVFARNLSALKEERVKASQTYKPEQRPHIEGVQQTIFEISQGLYLSKLTSYAQGFSLLRQAEKTYGWKLNLSRIALLWRAGCIIRSRFLENIKEAFEKNKSLSHLYLDPFFQKAIQEGEKSWRRSILLGVNLSIPMPCMASALAYFDGWRSETLPANLIQAQRDFFGAHTYEKVDRPRGEFFHTEWQKKQGVKS